LNRAVIAAVHESGFGTSRTSRSPLDMSVHWGETVMPTSRLKRRE
jgi:hypothetical protein